MIGCVHHPRLVYHPIQGQMIESKGCTCEPMLESSSYSHVTLFFMLMTSLSEIETSVRVFYDRVRADIMG